MAYFSNMTPEKFEVFCRQLFHARGFKDISDQYFQQKTTFSINPDFIVTDPEGEKIVVETKRIRDNNALKDALMILSSYVSLLKVTRAILISPQKLSPNLFDIAKSLNIEIWDEEYITKTVQTFPETFKPISGREYQPGQMQLKSIAINNFRGIRSLVFDLPITTVFVGKNGAGKSTILDGIATSLSWFCRRMINPNSSGSSILERDITNSEIEARIRIVTDIEGEEVDWEIISARSGFTQPQRSKYRKLSNKIENMQEGLIDPDVSLPVVVYYSIHRAVNQVPVDGSNLGESNRLRDLYSDAIGGDRQDFKGFFDWFRKQEDIENQKRSGGATDFRDPQLNAVRSAVLNILEGFSDLQVERTEKSTTMVAMKEEQKLEVNQLSDGEKCVIGMVGDLARRLAIANPSMPNPLDGYGIVLIDEIELHLHPQLQRRVIHFLRDTFQHCQFIITTHSAPVISHVRDYPIFLLSSSKNGLDIKPVHSYGRDVNQLLQNVFDTEERPFEVQENLNTCARLIDIDELDNAQKLLEKVADQIGKNDPEVVRLQAELDFLRN